jgi:acyl-CoA reductase-like NAD-dependent aldehyde dehydrogenase
MMDAVTPVPAGWATPTAPALLGNTVVWKPSPTQELATHLTMGLLAEAGLPPGVINLVTGDDRAASEVALADPELADYQALVTGKRKAGRMPRRSSELAG